jgi:hypothetical protein
MDNENPQMVTLCVPFLSIVRSLLDSALRSILYLTEKGFKEIWSVHNRSSYLVTEWTAVCGSRHKRKRRFQDTLTESYQIKEVYLYLWSVTVLSSNSNLWDVNWGSDRSSTCLSSHRCVRYDSLTSKVGWPILAHQAKSFLKLNGRYIGHRYLIFPETYI